MEQNIIRIDKTDFHFKELDNIDISKCKKKYKRNIIYVSF